MIEKRIEGSPIVYCTNKADYNNWVLFLHAAFVDRRMFNAQFEYFKNKLNILAVDIIGHGKSVNAQKGDGIERMSDYIKEIMTVEGIDKIHIVGVSLGAVLAQDFANKYPDMVKSLACFGGYDINNFDTKMQSENSSAQMLMMVKALFSVKWFAKANKKISAYTEKAQEEFYEMNVLFPKKSFMYMAGLNGMVNKQQTQKRNYPLLIGCGEHDIPMEHKAVKMWQSSEPDSKVVVIENAGHCANMDNPLAFNLALEEIWKA